ncbi:P-type DNA transfer ATPase VirB11 (plasmid) [Skermanella rosea]|uniref:P-type DNA transfer ATPase VirB11 n=1 Tax=Skermanella rosea TaxID=1817965 RepID=UPI0019316368|nr:P-type DNA transfer ATPase VirB11 [Skermanella rosea]UEM08133.1 P-type DNA transfer ATPase VirB11 [Skermanella rosea]
MTRQHEAIPLLSHALEPFQQWWSDPSVEDIMCQKPNEVWVRRGAETTRHEVPLDFVDMEGIAILAASLKRQNVGRAKPLLSCDLPGGTRLQAVLPPCVNDGTVALAIRRAKKAVPTLAELGQGGLFAEVEPLGGMSAADRQLIQLYAEARDAKDAQEREQRWIAFLRAAIRARKTIVNCGEVGSGKTYAALGLIGEIPLEDRIVIIGDADETSSLPHPNRVDLFFSKGEQGEAGVTANDLVEASLRLAMRWLILQELRGSEAFSFIRARRSGHPSLTTCHAENPKAVFPTLALMVKQSPAARDVDLATIEQSLHGLIDCICHFHRPDGKFRISDIWFRLAEEGR